MSRSLIQVANSFNQNVDENGIISPGAIIRRYGCDCQLNGNAVTVDGPGYYAVDASVTVIPTAVGVVTVALYENGVEVPGAFASTYAGTAAQPVAIPIVSTIRRGCNCCNGLSNLTFVLEEGTGVISNFSARVIKS
jgi:hypothetical protein